MKECVVVDGVRTPIGKSGWNGMKKGGQFAHVSAQILLGSAVAELVRRVDAKSEKFDPKEIEDLAVGCLSQIGEQGGNLGRLAVFLAELPDDVAGMTIDRYCNAGLQAINSMAQAIISGSGDIMIAAGVEHMSHYPMMSSISAAEAAGFPVMIEDKLYERNVFTPMGVAADLVAQKYNITRENCDGFALWSHQKATKALRDHHWYKKRIAPIRIIQPDGTIKTIEVDETIRTQSLDEPEYARSKLQKLEPRFSSDGVHTAGNSSQIVDGAAAAMLMSRGKAEKLGLTPLATIKSMAVAGDDPEIMLLGPIPAMRKALKRAGNLTIADMDVIEPNEAFASPPLAFAKEFDYALDDPRVNPTGGAIALGHPIGATGVIYFIEMIYEMQKRKLRYGIETLCGGGGVGIATVVEREE
ncbi:MAG: thiolase family protein [Candidatus Bathyarchaeota archaeon]|nr:MAG: thiolase family protein [Candidatus Bathyarchaeota archaeon]